MSKKRDTQRLLKFVSQKLKSKGYSDTLIKSIVNSERYRIGGFKLSQSNIKGQAVKLNPNHKSYALRVFGDKGNCNGEKVHHTPTLEQQRKAYFTVNPTGVYGGEQKTPYRVRDRIDGDFNKILSTPNTKSAYLP